MYGACSIAIADGIASTTFTFNRISLSLSMNSLVLILIVTSVTAGPSPTPKFGDRIGKLKRNFQSTSTSTTTAVPVEESDEEFQHNGIARSDEYYLMDELEQNKSDFMVIKEQPVTTMTTTTTGKGKKLELDVYRGTRRGPKFFKLNWT